MNEIVIGTTADQCGLVVFPSFANEIALAFVRLLIGKINPEQFFQIVNEIDPAAIGFARKIVEACIGAGA